jgi:hypothetical protein
MNVSGILRFFSITAMSIKISMTSAGNKSLGTANAAVPCSLHNSNFSECMKNKGTCSCSSSRALSESSQGKAELWVIEGR